MAALAENHACDAERAGVLTASGDGLSRINLGCGTERAVLAQFCPSRSLFEIARARAFFRHGVRSTNV